jgi:hypothetical protein
MGLRTGKAPLPNRLNGKYGTGLLTKVENIKKKQAGK